MTTANPHSCETNNLVSTRAVLKGSLKGSTLTHPHHQTMHNPVYQTKLTRQLIKPSFKRAVKASLGVLLGLTLQLGATTTNAEAIDHLRMASGLGFNSFDPVFATPQTVDYLRPIYDTLVVRRGMDTFKPGLASSWEYNDDYTQLTLNLREGLQFTDGEPFNAAAVKANLERGQAASGSPWAGLYRTIDRIETPSDYEVVLHLRRPDPTVFEYFSTTPGMMVSPKAMENESELTFNPVGIGPWKFDGKNSARGDKYAYVANDEYWNPDEQPVNAITIYQMTDPATRVNALRSGQLDIAAITQTQGRALEGLGFTVMPTNMVFYLMGVWDSEGTIVPALGDPKVRKAIRLALNRDAILRALYDGRGRGEVNFYPEGVSGYSEELAKIESYNLRLARELMEEAGYKDGFDVDVVVQTNNARIAEALSGELAKIGVRLDIAVMPDVGSFHAAVHQKKSPLGIFAHQAALPAGLYNALMSENGRYNPFGNTHQDLDALMDEAAQSSEDDAKALYGKVFNEIAGERALYFPIVQAEILAAMRSDIEAGAPTYTDAGLPNPRYLSVINE